MDRHGGDQIENGLVGHAADGEGDGADVELAGEDRPAQLLHDVFERIPVPAYHCSIIQRKAAIFVCIRVPEVVIQVLNRLPVLHQGPDSLSLSLRLFMAVGLFVI